MNTSLPRWFKPLLVAVLLLCSVVTAVSLFQQAQLTADIAKAQRDLDTLQGRLRKQEQEYAEVIEALPATLTELEEIRPQAQAAYEQEQALRQQRKDLRTENAAQAEEITALTATVAQDGDVSDTLEAIRQLESALFALHQITQSGQ